MRGCLTCRQRHLKCDKTGTECLRCQRSGRQCIPAPAKPEEVAFRHGQNPSLRTKGPPRYGESDLTFPDDQIWVKMPAKVAFEDETDRTAADYEVVSVGTSPLHMRAASESRSSANLAMSTPSAVPNDMIPHYSPGDLVATMGMQSGSASALLPPDALVGRQQLSNPNEAFLLRHFRRALGPWLDVCDPERHFSVNVVEQAPSCPLLLYACLAISARHLSHTTNSIPPHTADEYHERCIAILLPVLEDPNFQISIEILLASTVMLRFFEQISSHTPSSDQQRHLLAGSVYISSHLDCAIAGGLAEASFWTFVIQDIQFGMAYHTPLRLPFVPFEEKLRQYWRSRKSTSLTDRDWTHQAIWILAETINYCYGRNMGNPALIPIDGDALKRKIYMWETERPESFRPLHFSPADLRSGKPFPTVWFNSSWHSTAIQHVCMAKALIHEYELRFSHMGPESEQHIRRVKEEVIENLSILFGIALSTDDPAARTMACHTPCACGSWIQDPMAQNCVLELLRRTEAENGWPWAYIVQRLSAEWRRNI